jgi:hypothetical protein
MIEIEYEDEYDWGTIARKDKRADEGARGPSLDRRTIVLVLQSSSSSSSSSYSESVTLTP